MPANQAPTADDRKQKRRTTIRSSSAALKMCLPPNSSDDSQTLQGGTRPTRQAEARRGLSDAGVPFGLISDPLSVIPRKTRVPFRPLIEGLTAIRSRANLNPTIRYGRPLDTSAISPPRKPCPENNRAMLRAIEAHAGRIKARILGKDA